MTVSTASMDAPAVAYEIGRACAEHDQPDIPHPSLDDFLTGLANPWPGQAFERCFGCLDGEPVGYLELGLPLMDNVDNRRSHGRSGRSTG